MRIETVLIGDNEDGDGLYFYEVHDLDRCQSTIFCTFETEAGWMFDFTGGEGPWSELRFPSRQAAVDAASRVAFEPGS